MDDSLGLVTQPSAVSSLVLYIPRRPQAPLKGRQRADRKPVVYRGNLAETFLRDSRALARREQKRTDSVVTWTTTGVAGPSWVPRLRLCGRCAAPGLQYSSGGWIESDGQGRLGHRGVEKPVGNREKIREG